MAPAPSPAPAPVSTSLDLSTPEPTPIPQLRGRKAAPSRPTWPQHRTKVDTPTILDDVEPAVTLTRRQSGIGTLTVDAACSAAVGDLRLGCAFQLRSGASSVVAHVDGIRFGPADAANPVVVSSHDRYERISVDLRQVRDLERFLVYAFSGDGSPLSWGGTLQLTTYGEARIETSLESKPFSGVFVLLSAYNVDGELVLRAEREPAEATIREACRAYGYGNIAWLDDRLPAGH